VLAIYKSHAVFFTVDNHCLSLTSCADLSWSITENKVWGEICLLCWIT